MRTAAVVAAVVDPVAGFAKRQDIRRQNITFISISIRVSFPVLPVLFHISLLMPVK